MKMASKGPEDNEEIPSKTSSDKSGDPAPEQRPERSDYKGDSELWRREAQFTLHRDVCKARASGSRAALAEVPGPACSSRLVRYGTDPGNLCGLLCMRETETGKC